jgi:CubicO group peptidase (beta-lactamase class C family)
MGLLYGGLQAQTNLKMSEARIDDIFSKWDQPGSPGCAIGIYSEGKIIFSEGYGEAVLESNMAIRPQTVFYTGSVSKQFTAAAIALLHIRGELDLDQPVRHYIPEMPDYPGTREPTVRQLVHHTSGLPDLYSLLSLYDIRLKDGVPGEELLNIITGQRHLNFEPGSEYLYSNSGYTLLAELVERISGQSLREYTTEQLFEPLGMDHTHFHDDHAHTIDDQALSYRGNKNFRLSYLSSFEGVGPGGLYTTIGDMLKWDQQLYKNKLPDAEGFNELMHRHGVLNNGDTLSYAFALRIDEYKGQKSVGHGGSFMGFKANYLRLPEHQYGSAVLCNLGSIDPEELNRKLADVVLKAPIEKWLTRYAGDYYSEALDLKYTIAVKDGNLYLDRETTPSGRLTYTDDHTFSTGSWKVGFKATGQDKVAGFKLSSSRAKNICFQKQ